MKKLVIIDPTLKSRIGHAYQYNKNIVDHFLNFQCECKIYANIKYKNYSINDLEKIVPMFSISPNDTSKLKIFQPIIKIFKNFFILSKELSEIMLLEDNKNAVFYIQHTDAYLLFALLNLKKLKGKIIIMLRSTSHSLDKKDKPTFRSYLYKFVTRKIHKRYENRVVFTSDSLELKHEYEKIIKLKVHVLPIPSRIINSTEHNKKINVVYLGRLSIDKGANFLIDIVKALSSNKNIIFHIHSYSDYNDINKINPIVNELKKISSKKIILYEAPLSQNDLDKQLKLADIALLLYDIHRYKRQTSGVLIDCITSNTYPIVSKETWLETIVKENKFGAVVDISSHRNCITSVKKLVEGFKMQKYENFHEIQKKYTIDKFYNIFLEIIKDN